MVNVNKLFEIAKPRSDKALRAAKERKLKRCMKLENVKNQIDSAIDSMLPEELYNALKDCGMPDQLKVGDRFQQNYHSSSGLMFTILDIKPEKNWCEVFVTNISDNCSWTEEWDNLHTVYQALSIGEYKLI